MKAELVSVGTELLLGQITDTNAVYLAQQLSPLGIDLYWISAVGDNLGRLSDVVRRGLSRSDLIIMTGGLGPTEDDLTREAICEVLGERMVVVAELEADLRDFFKRRGVQMPERNVKQATLIPSAKALANPIGTAPGWWVEKDGHIIVGMPGVPVEMRRMWEHEVAPQLRQRLGGQIIYSKTLKIIGLGESTVGDMIADLLQSTNPTFATYAKNDGIHVRITAKARSEEQAAALIAEPERQARAILGNTVYGVDEDTLEGAVGRLLRERGLTIATCEGVTAGLLASTIASVPGSSAYFKGGVVAYSADAKALAGVEPAVLSEHGLVGPAASRALAAAARAQLDADVGVGVTGVAGPESLGDLPAGSFWLAINDRGQLLEETTNWRTTRNEVRRRAVLAALAGVRRSLLSGE
ncbi:MAG: competence/damage-inducible protein A [Chloroflexota bacterium]